MRNEIDTTPDLEISGISFITRLWRLDKYVQLPPSFASPDLRMVEFPDWPNVWEIAQASTHARCVGLEIESVTPTRINASFYDAVEQERVPNRDEEAAVAQISEIAREIIRLYEHNGTLV